jgi:hypothetical protein
LLNIKAIATKNLYNSTQIITASEERAFTHK